MGDRANIAFRQNSSAEKKQKRKPQFIFLYTHWAGPSIADRLQEALKFGQSRWGDEAYLTRICVTRITADHADSETGFGLSTYPTDNSYPVLEVDADAKQVRLINQAGWHEGKWNHENVLETWTFEEFCALTEPSAAMNGE